MAQLAFSFDLFDEEAPALSAPAEAARLPLVVAVEQSVAPPQAVWRALELASPTPVANPIRYVLDDYLLEGRGTPQAKYAANVAAIRLLDQLNAESRAPSAEERDCLACYAGWGGVPQPFAAEASQGWEAKRDELAQLLGDRIKAVRASTPNAHFTPFAVIDAVWAAVRRLGFTGGRVLEPSAGVGHFLGRMPDALRCATQVTAVEVEPVTASILRHLYPEADVRADGFERFSAPRGGFDLAIGNVPFGEYRLHDPALDHFKLRIHDYFIMKCCQQVRKGGLVALITSSSTMDSAKSKTLRKWLAEYTQVVAAVRLPNGTFAESANTDVATDLLLLKVTRSPVAQPEINESVMAQRLASHLSDRLGSANQYWLTHPQHVMGTWARVKGQFSDLLGVNRPADFETRLAGLVMSLPQGVLEPRESTPRSSALQYDNASEGELKRDESGTLCRFQDGAWEPLPARGRERICDLYALGNLLQRLLAAQNAQPADEEHMEALRRQLDASYDAFVGEYGAISKRVNILAIKNWSVLPLLLSLEHWDERRQVARKAAIFTVRTTHAPEKPAKADSPESALMIAFGENLRVDLGRIAGLLDVTEAEAGAELERLELANFCPVEGRHIIAEEYLSGDVREKFAQIESFARSSARFEGNRAALRKVIPKDLEAKEIAVQLGAPWLPIDVITQFVRELTADESATVTRSVALARWDVSAWSSPAAKVQWGHKSLDVGQLIQHALNGKRPTVHVPGSEPPIVDPIETAAARDKMGRIQDHFKTWIWDDDARTAALVDLYNRRFNSVVPRRYDGKFLTFPDKSEQVTFRSSQREAIARGLIAGPTLVAHKTGAGKTMILCAIAHESRRLGLSRKACIVVQNSTLYQFAAEYMRLYPGAKILVPDRDELSGTKRRAMIAKIATGDWEAVIVAHSSLERLGMGEAAVEAVRTYLCEPIDVELSTAQTQDVKRLETQRKRLNEILARLLNRRGADDHLKFEDLAIDNLLVDEAHRFKNLWFFTSRPRVAGLQQSASRRALDLLAKTLWLYQRHGRPYGLTLATATPITNTIAEIYTMQRFLQLHVLRENGLEHFDAWASMFGEVVSSVEVTPTGRGFRVHERFARFHNVPELMRLYLQCADIRNKASLEGILKEPAIAGGKPILIAAKCHPLQAEYISTLVERAERIRNREVDASVDNMLKVVHDGRMVALDMRLVIPGAPDWEGSKVNLEVERIFRHWEEGKEAKTTQLIFSDLSVPQKNGAWSVYEDIRKKLIAKGVPEDEIAFAQFAETDRERAALFQRIRDGDVRIALGSTERLGTGTNVQDRIIAMHHLDVPWRPSDLDQRDGRGLRDGNVHDEVFVYRAVTESSFDAYMWQTAEVKQKFILQVMDPEMKLRTVEDIAMATLTYAEVKAAASGDPAVIEKITIDAELAKLNLLSVADSSRRQELRWRAGRAVRSEVDCDAKIARLETWLKQYIEGPAPTALRILRSDKVLPIGEVPPDLIQQILNAEAFRQKVDFSTKAIVEVGGVGLTWSSHDGFQLLLPPADKFDDPTLISVGFAETSAGFKRMIDNIPAAAERHIAKVRNDKRLSREEAVRVDLELAKPWEYQEKFDRLSARADELARLFELNASENTAGLSDAPEPVSTETAEEEADELVEA